MKNKIKNIKIYPRKGCIAQLRPDYLESGKIVKIIDEGKANGRNECMDETGIWYKQWALECRCDLCLKTNNKKET